MSSSRRSEAEEARLNVGLDAILAKTQEISTALYKLQDEIHRGHARTTWESVQEHFQHIQSE